MGLLKGPTRASKLEAAAQEAPKSLAVAYSVHKQAGKGAPARAPIASTEAALERPLSISAAIRRKMRPAEDSDSDQIYADSENQPNQWDDSEPLDTIDEMSEVETLTPPSRVAAIRQRMKAPR